ncbi:hypothetical protein [Apilactobacillus quenuiae]|uniref:hypothetical protein n=1 Tax=Apilactobacillus quenuiae TaxID=2008377 RepID=UPI000D01BBC9|nr:hypothetical protein [Apilactobacillus quenuiae]
MKKIIIALFIAVGTASVFAYNSNKTEASAKLAPWSQQQVSADTAAQPTQLRLNSNHEVYYQYSGYQYAAQKKIWQNAIKNWNRLGVIKIVPNKHDGKATVINLHVDNPYDDANDDLPESDSQQVEGMTISHFDNDGRNVTCYLTGTTFFNSSKTNSQIATHEMGHALGFDHDSRQIHHRYFIMHADSIRTHEFKLGNYEKRTLQHYYKDQLN